MSDMSIIKPTVVTEGMLTSSTAAEPGPDEVAWTNVAWAKDATCYLATTHSRYQAAVAVAAGGVSPDLDIANATTATPAKWLKLGPTNKWAMFDRKLGTLTTVDSPLTVTLRPGGMSGIALLELTGRKATITLRAAPGGTAVYDRTVDLDGSLIESIYDWFYVEYEQRSDLVLTDLPPVYLTGELTVTITGTGPVSCGVMQVGQVIHIGGTQYGASVGIVDYSVKKPDAFGNMDVVERDFSRRMSLKVVTEKSDFNRIFRVLASVRAILCVYIATEAGGFEPMIAYGFYKDFSIEISYPLFHLCNLEIEGIAT